MRNVALIAKRGTGKSSCRRLLEARGYEVMSWADPVRQIAAMAYDSRFTGSPEDYAAAKVARFGVTLDEQEQEVSGTWLLQRIGTDAIRDHVDRDFWVKAAMRRIGSRVGPYVNDDTRFRNEVQALKANDWLIVGLRCSEEERIQRLVSRDGVFDPTLEGHPSETSLNVDDADLVIETDGKTLVQVVEELLTLVA